MFDATAHRPNPVPATATRATAWSDMPTGEGRLSELRRQLRVLQVHRAAARGLAA